MRVVVCKELGPPEALVVEERPTPEPGDGQVRIAVRAAGVNYVDGLIAAGRYQIRIEPPFVPGSELAGVVDAIGPGVEGLAVGDRVFATLGTGGFAEYAIARPVAVTPIPDSLDFARAASFHQSYCTAWFALVRRTVVRPGETVLVTGAGGGVGLAAVDVARALGARVIAVASTPEKRALAMQMGAEATIDPNVDDIKTRARELAGSGGVDVVYDAVGGELAEASLRALRFDGRFCVIGFTGGIPRIPLNLVLLNNRTVVGVDWGAWVGQNQAENQAMLREVMQNIVAGKLHPVEPVSYPMSRAVDAMRDLQNRKVAGKVALVPDFD